MTIVFHSAWGVLWAAFLFWLPWQAFDYAKGRVQRALRSEAASEASSTQCEHDA